MPLSKILMKSEREFWIFEPDALPKSGGIMPLKNEKSGRSQGENFENSKGESFEKSERSDFENEIFSTDSLSKSGRQNEIER